LEKPEISAIFTALIPFSARAINTILWMAIEAASDMEKIFAINYIQVLECANIQTKFGSARKN
jgi:hypothetical protein